jgi:hypothetical protein
MNGMYGNYGGNMGMGMNDMSAMNYNGGYGGWNGMGGGYGNYNNGFNSMGGYNQSGAYPEMMNQFPKNNFQNQNQTRFPANQGGAHPQRNMRNGSHGSFGPGVQNANSRPGSQSGPVPNVRRFHHLPPKPTPPVGRSPIRTITDECVFPQRDGQSPDGTANAASDAKPGDNEAKATAEATDEGKANDEATTESADPPAQDATSSGDVLKVAGDATDSAGNAMNETGGLKPIQTFDSGDAEMDDYSQPMMGNGMAYQQGMMGQGYDQSHMDPNFNPNMNMGYNNYGARGAYNNGAYGAAKVLIDQPAAPIGVGVVGAPTGPRAMREGRPNTGFSSRVNSARFVPPPKSVTSTHEVVPASPQRRVRSYVPDSHVDRTGLTYSGDLHSETRACVLTTSRPHARDLDHEGGERTGTNIESDHARRIGNRVVKSVNDPSHRGSRTTTTNARIVANIGRLNTMIEKKSTMTADVTIGRVVVIGHVAHQWSRSIAAAAGIRINTDHHAPTVTEARSIAAVKRSTKKTRVTLEAKRDRTAAHGASIGATRTSTTTDRGTKIETVRTGKSEIVTTTMSDLATKTRIASVAKIVGLKRTSATTTMISIVLHVAAARTANVSAHLATMSAIEMIVTIETRKTRKSQWTKRKTSLVQ